MRILLFVALTALGSSFAAADVGALDRYECHKHAETGKYHCHGNADLAKLGGLVLGADLRTEGWSTNEAFYMFIGIAGNVEYNYRWAAVTGSYFFMPMVTNAESLEYDDSIYQQGWAAGIKLGPGVGRLGPKYYVTTGWRSAQITDTGNSNNDGTFSGYYVGAGTGVNTRTMAFDLVATYYDAAELEDYLGETQGNTLSVNSFDIRASLGWRF